MLELREPRLAAPRQARSIARHRRLRQSARDVFAEYGYEAATVDMITRRSGMAVGAFYLYYRSKRQLLVDLMREFLDMLHRLDLTPPAGATSRRLRLALRRFLGSALRTDRENYGVIRAWHEAIRTDAELARLDARIGRWSEARVRHVFAAIADHPASRSRHDDLGEFARIMNRHFWALLARATTMSQKDFDAEVRVTSDIVYHYLIRDR